MVAWHSRMPGATGQDNEGPRFDAALFVCGLDLIAGNERLRDLGCKKDRSLIGFFASVGLEQWVVAEVWRRDRARRVRAGQIRKWVRGLPLLNVYFCGALVCLIQTTAMDA